jgi:hypothetical protein
VASRPIIDKPTYRALQSLVGRLNLGV